MELENQLHRCWYLYLAAEVVAGQTNVGKRGQKEKRRKEDSVCSLIIASGPMDSLLKPGQTRLKSQQIILAIEKGVCNDPWLSGCYLTISLSGTPSTLAG